MQTAVPDGVYRIASVATGQYLTLGGPALRGSVQCRNRGSARDRDTVRQQEWLVARVPGLPEWYNIINVFWGVLAGVYQPEQEQGEGAKWLKASPASANTHAAHWSFTDTDGAWRVHWRIQSWGPRVLELPKAQRNGACRVMPADSSNGQLWTLEHDHELEAAQHGLAGWMSRVPSSTYLSQISIPATHQSIAINDGLLIQNARCQARSMYEQLLGGIRVFDLRFDRYTAAGQADCLYAKHNFVHEIFSFAAVLQTLQLFVTQCPSETVTIIIRNENDTEGFLPACLEDFSLFVDAYPSMWFDLGGGKRMCETTLGQVRGKVIVLTPHGGTNQLPSLASAEASNDEHGAGMSYRKYWAKESTFWGTGDDYISAGQYNKWLPHQWRKNFDNCRANVHRAIGDPRADRVYATYWNVSGFPGCMSDPWNFVQSAQAWFAASYDPSIIGEGGSRHRSGVSWFDFYHEVKYVRDIVRSNVGCGNLDA